MAIDYAFQPTWLLKERYIMKPWIYGIALALLPAFYIGLMYLTEKPVEWSVLGIMALFVLPIIILRKKIGAVEQQVNSMSDEDKLQAMACNAAKLVRKASGAE